MKNFIFSLFLLVVCASCSETKLNSDSAGDTSVNPILSEKLKLYKANIPTSIKASKSGYVKIAQVLKNSTVLNISGLTEVCSLAGGKDSSSLEHLEAPCLSLNKAIKE